MVKGSDYARCATAPPCTKSLSCTICLVHRAHALSLGDLHSVEYVTAVVELKLIKFSKLKNLFNACLPLAKHFCMVPFFVLYLYGYAPGGRV